MRHPRLLTELATLTILATAACEPPRAAPRRYILRGTLVTPIHVIPDGSLLVEGTTITQLEPGPIVAPPPGATVVDVHGIILPGMIDVHDHLVWNVFPRWDPGAVFENRDEWQRTRGYAVALKNPKEALDDVLRCAMDRYAEVKAIAGGATAVVASPSQQCVDGLARNLDFNPGIRTIGSLRYEVFPLGMSGPAAAQLGEDMKSGAVTSLFVHLAEGTDASSRSELDSLKRLGLFRSGTTIIHGIALQATDFQLMAYSGVGLVWSPRSNFALYGRTADVGAAKAAGVTIALGPDWSPTGSSGMLNELRYAAQLPRGGAPHLFSDSELVRMATLVPAQLARVDDWIGSLEPGHYADLIVLRGVRETTSAAVYHAIVDARPEDLRLVVIGGEPVYGEPALMSQLAPNRIFETRTVCGAQRAFHLSGQGPGTLLSATEAALQQQLSAYQIDLAPLQECP